MTRRFYAVMIPVMLIGSVVCVRSEARPSQGKTVLLDVPSIAERVNEVVVNVRALSEAGENLGSGFIIDKRGLIATNFHLISNAEPHRGSGSWHGQRRKQLASD